MKSYRAFLKVEVVGLSKKNLCSICSIVLLPLLSTLRFGFLSPSRRPRNGLNSNQIDLSHEFAVGCYGSFRFLLVRAMERSYTPGEFEKMDGTARQTEGIEGFDATERQSIISSKCKTIVCETLEFFADQHLSFSDSCSLDESKIGM